METFQQEVTPKVAKIELFEDLNLREIDQVLHCFHIQRKTYRKGERVHEIGDSYESVGVILEGRVQMQGVDFWGNLHLIKEFRALEIYGDGHSMTRDPMFFEMVAMEPTTILFIHIKSIIHTCHHSCAAHQKVIYNFLQIIARKKLDYMQQVDMLSQRSIREKVQRFLSQQSKIQGSLTFRIPYSRQQLADYLAVDRSALSRELSAMQQEGILTYYRDKFTLKK